MTVSSKPFRPGGDRQVIRVFAPTAQAGIGDALRRAFTPPPIDNRDRELLQILDQV